MAVKRISPSEAKQLLDQGYVYIDVRSAPEFEQGHPPGARNVPIAHLGGAGMVANPDFVAAMKAHFPADANLVLGCKGGVRSQRAAMMLEAAGFTNLVEMRGGWAGETDAMGREVERGWAPAGLPVEMETHPGASWEELAPRR